MIGRSSPSLHGCHKLSMRINAWKLFLRDVFDEHAGIVRMRGPGECQGLRGQFAEKQLLSGNAEMFAAVSVDFDGVRLQPGAVSLELVVLGTGPRQVLRVSR